MAKIRTLKWIKKAIEFRKTGVQKYTRIGNEAMIEQYERDLRDLEYLKKLVEKDVRLTKVSNRIRKDMEDGNGYRGQKSDLNER